MYKPAPVDVAHSDFQLVDDIPVRTTSFSTIQSDNQTRTVGHGDQSLNSQCTHATSSAASNFRKSQVNILRTTSANAANTVVPFRELSLPLRGADSYLTTTPEHQVDIDEEDPPSPATIAAMHSLYDDLDTSLCLKHEHTEATAPSMHHAHSFSEVGHRDSTIEREIHLEYSRSRMVAKIWRMDPLTPHFLGHDRLLTSPSTVSQWYGRRSSVCLMGDPSSRSSLFCRYE